MAAAFALAFLPVPIHAPLAQAPSGPAPVQSQPLPPAQPSPPAAQPAPPPATQPTPPSAGPVAPTADPFGEEIMLPPRTIVYLSGSGTWDSAFETLVDSFKSVNSFLEQQGIKPAGLPMTVYTATDDTGFSYQAAVPIAAAPATPPRGDISLGQAPAGKMLKFVHRGSYDAMDTTYEAITNFLDTKQLEAQDLFVEEYVTDPVTTPEEKLVVNVFVPIK
jgi:effector-binding domain-containing protein